MMDKAIELTYDDIKRAAVKADRVDMGPTASGGVLNTEGFLHIHKDDVLVLITPKMLYPPERKKEEKAISERLGVKTVIIAAGLEVIGVVEHGA